MIQKLLLIVITLAFSGCTYLTSVSTSSIPIDRSIKISAEVKKTYWFGFNFNNSYVNEISEKLARKCSNGKVEGILTKFEFTTYFIGIVNEVSVNATGYCVRK